MNYQKIDAALASALEQPGSVEEPRLVVSVRTLGPLDQAQQAELCDLGVQGVESGRNVFSAQLSPRSVEVLADKPWVRLLSLARVLRPLSS